MKKRIAHSWRKITLPIFALMMIGTCANATPITYDVFLVPNSSAPGLVGVGSFTYDPAIPPSADPNAYTEADMTQFVFDISGISAGGGTMHVDLARLLASPSNNVFVRFDANFLPTAFNLRVRDEAAGGYTDGYAINNADRGWDFLFGSAGATGSWRYSFEPAAPVPDGGTTALMLGVGLLGLAGAKRKQRRS